MIPRHGSKCKKKRGSRPLQVEHADLAGLGQIAEGAGGLQGVDVGLRDLRAGGGELLDGEEGLSDASLRNILCRVFAQAGDCHKGRKELILPGQEHHYDFKHEQYFERRKRDFFERALK